MRDKPTGPNPDKPPESGVVTITREGIDYMGVFAIDGNTITVTHGSHQKYTHVSGSWRMPQFLAQALLSELVTESLADT